MLSAKPRSRDATEADTPVQYLVALIHSTSQTAGKKRIRLLPTGEKRSVLQRLAFSNSDSKALLVVLSAKSVDLDLSDAGVRSSLTGGEMKPNTEITYLTRHVPLRSH